MFDKTNLPPKQLKQSTENTFIISGLRKRIAIGKYLKSLAFLL